LDEFFELGIILEVTDHEAAVLMVEELSEVEGVGD